ncbi:MAG: hypothetical protein LBS89_07310 [Zoogloeaceae bacterium]|jgi:hypothetical protein|nr:hypothetical protein [Zoogloeaceae bacterium]
MLLPEYFALHFEEPGHLAFSVVDTPSHASSACPGVQAEVPFFALKPILKLEAQRALFSKSRSCGAKGVGKAFVGRLNKKIRLKHLIDKPFFCYHPKLSGSSGENWCRREPLPRR